MNKTVRQIGIAILTISIMTVTASCASQNAAPATLPSSKPSMPIINPTAEPQTTTEPMYDLSTHENGYCEGECWEGNCPYFTSYPEPPFTDDDIAILAKMVWGEARGCTTEEQRLVVWTVLQRVDADGEFRNYNTIEAVVTKEGQFLGYNENHSIDPDIYELCLEVLMDWWHGAEPLTHEIYAPTAPYYFFDGDGKHNWFREEWR